MDPLIETLGKIRFRLAIQQWLCFSAVGLLASVTCCCVWLLLCRLFPLLWSGNWVFVVIVFLGLAIAAARAFEKRPTMVEAALEADQRLGLEERFTSSYQLASREGSMLDALHKDARSHLNVLNLRRDFPFALPLSSRWLVIPILLFGLGYLFLPEFDLFGFEARQVEAKTRKEARRVNAGRLKAAARVIQKNENAMKGNSALNTASEIERLAEELASGEVTEKQAIAKINNLAKELEKQRDALQKASAMPKLSDTAGRLGSTQEMARNIAKGNFAEAAQKATELQKKLKEGTLSEEEKKKLAKELREMSEAMKGPDGAQSTVLSEALAKAAAGLAQGGDGKAGDLKSLEEVELALEDVASVLDQLDKLNDAMFELAEWQNSMLGPSKTCRMCGKELMPCKNPGNCKGCGPGHCCYGVCSSCCSGKGWCECAGRCPWQPGTAEKFSNGMGKAGHGRGASTGPLPDVQDGFSPTMLPGDMTRGRFLAGVVQRASPEGTAEPTAEFVSGVLLEAQQEAEKALTKEEIPPGAREFVRQYFNTFAPESRTHQGAVNQTGNQTSEEVP